MSSSGRRQSGPGSRLFSRRDRECPEDARPVLDADRALHEVTVKRQIVALCETETDQTGGKPLAIRILHLLATLEDR